MQKSRFSEEQILSVLKEHQAGHSAAELCRKYGVSDTTFYKWRAKYGGSGGLEVNRLKTLEVENAKLKKLLEEVVPDASAIREMLNQDF